MLARINKRYVPAYWDDFFNDNFFNKYAAADCNYNSPAVNIVEDDNEYRIEMAVPGMSKKDFNINLEDDVLTISREQNEEKKEDNLRYMRREFSYSTFKRSFQLPDTVDQEKIKASQESGIISIQLPKRKEVVQKTQKQIEIK